MAWYSSDRRILRRQAALDIGLLAWIVVWTLLGITVAGIIRGLTGPLRSAVRSVEALRDNIHQTAVGASGLPVGGGALRPPLDAASGDANSLVAALNDQIRAIELAANATAVAMVLVPLGLFLVWWLPRRLRTTKARAAGSRGDGADRPAAMPVRAGTAKAVASRPATSAAAAGGDVTPEERLAALRSLVTADPSVLLRVSEDPVAAWARGDREVIRTLDALDAASRHRED